MEDFVRLLTGTSRDIGCLYAKADTIEAFGDCACPENSIAKGFVQIKGIKYEVLEGADDIFLKIEKVRKSLQKKEREKEMNASRKAEEYRRKTLIENGNFPSDQAMKELWLDEEIKHDTKGIEGFSTRVYNAFTRYFAKHGYNKATWRDVYNLRGDIKIRGLSKNSIAEAKEFIKGRLTSV